MKEGGSGNKKVEWGQLERKKRGGEGGRERINKSGTEGWETAVMEDK